MILPRRRVAPFLLALLLIAGPLAAVTYQPREVQQPQLSVIGLLSEAWALICQIWEKAGSGSDPFGNPKPTSQPGDSTSAEPASGK